MRRNRANWRDWYLVTVVTGVVAFCLGPSLVGVRTLLSVNLLSNFYPWVAVNGDTLRGHNACQGDTVDSGMPGMDHIRNQIFAGHLASWQSVVAGGGPLGGLPDVGLLDPLSLPYWILPLRLAPAFVALLIFVVGIGGTFLFLRRLGVSRPAATLAGLIFVTSGFMVMWGNYPQVRVAALIPALFWAVERLVQRTRLSDVVLVAVVVASMLLGGFPAVTGYALYLAAGYLIVRLWVRHRHDVAAAVRPLLLAAGGLITGFLLAGVQLLPFLYFYNHSDLGYRAGDAHQGLPASGLLTLFAPNAYGECVAGQTVRGNVNAVELIGYVGAAALILALAGAAYGLSRRTGEEREGFGVRGYFVAGAVVVLLLGWLSPSVRSVVAGLPVFSGNFIGRIRSVLGFAIAVLAAIGFDWMTADRSGPDTEGTPVPPRDLRRWLWPAVVTVATLVTGVLVLRKAHEAALTGHYWRALEHALWIPAVLLVATFLLLALARLAGGRAQLLAFLAVPLIVAAQGAQFFHAVMPGDNPDNFYPKTGAHQFLAANLGHDRFASSNRTMYTGTALYYDLRTPTGHQFQEPEWKALLTAVDPKVMNTPTFSDFTGAISDTNAGDQPILDAMGVKYFVSPPTDLAGDAQPLPALNGTVTASAGAATCVLPGQPLRGVTFEVARPLIDPSATRSITFDVAVHSAQGTITSGRYMAGNVPAATLVSVAVPGEDLGPASGPLSVSISQVGGPGDLVVGGHDGSVACAAVTPKADGLRLVHADPGSIIYQRLDALPRIRWASQAVVIGASGARVAALQQGLPADQIVLDQAGPAGSGQPATVDVLTDSGDDITAAVNAGGDGYLVVADAMLQPGWRATVDGHPAAMVAADDAMAAVHVPAGSHRIAFHYTTPDQEKGLLLTVVAVLIIALLLAWPRLSRVVRRRAPRHAVRRHEPEEPVDDAEIREPT